MSVKNRFFWIAALTGLALDQVTKYWIVQSLRLEEVVPLWENILHLTYVTNKGAAFSLFTGGVWWLRWLSLLVSLALMALAAFGPRMNRWEEWGYGFILAGALGNGLDRFLAGEVVDFLQTPSVFFPVVRWNPFEINFIPFPIFNLADVFINVGIICLLIAMVALPKRSHTDSEP